MVVTIRDLDLDIFTLYALIFPFLVKKRPGIFLRVLKGTAKTQFEEAIMDFQIQVLEEYDDEAIQ